MKHKNVFLAGYFFLLSLFGFQLDVHSQPKDDWQAGSAYQLCGKTSTLYCFIETADNPWTEAEKEASLSALQQAQNWLMHQAGKWHVSLTFQNHALTSEAIVVPTIAEGTGSGKERVDWVHQLVNDLGYSNTKSAYRKLRRKYGNKNLQLIIFARANGTSYAMRFANGMRKKKFFLEGILLYQQYSGGSAMPTAAVLAHELLHLYGAWDLYTTYAQTADRHAKAIEHYPNDIMLRVDFRLENLQVDQLTAWLIGWNKNEEASFEWFRPADFQR